MPVARPPIPANDPFTSVELCPEPSAADMTAEPSVVCGLILPAVHTDQLLHVQRRTPLSQLANVLPLRPGDFRVASYELSTGASWYDLLVQELHTYLLTRSTNEPTQLTADDLEQTVVWGVRSWFDTQAERFHLIVDHSLLIYLNRDDPHQLATLFGLPRGAYDVFVDPDSLDHTRLGYRWQSGQIIAEHLRLI